MDGITNEKKGEEWKFVEENKDMYACKDTPGAARMAAGCCAAAVRAVIEDFSCCS